MIAKMELSGKEGWKPNLPSTYKAVVLTVLNVACCPSWRCAIAQAWMGGGQAENMNLHVRKVVTKWLWVAMG